MQKQVSRQSLAIVALSILLTLAIALTFTFAAFGANTNARGVITFQADNYTITANEGLTAVVEEDGTDYAGFTYKFAATVNVDGEIDYGENVPSFLFQSNKDGAALYCGVKVTLTDLEGSGSLAGFTINYTGTITSTDAFFKDQLIAGENNSKTTGITIKLTDVVEKIDIDYAEAGAVDGTTKLIFTVIAECGSVATDVDFVA